MRAKHRCSMCKKNFLVTEYKTKCQRCVLKSPKMLSTKFQLIVNHESMRSFRDYMEKWYGAAA